MQDYFETAQYKRTCVYLDDRHEKPKHLFKVSGDKIEEHFKSRPKTIPALLDVGGAPGDFVYY